MWNRKDVKARARKSLQNNFWKGVLVTLILGAVGGGVYFGGGGGSASAIAANNFNLYNNHKVYQVQDDGKSVIRAEIPSISNDVVEMDENGKFTVKREENKDIENKINEELNEAGKEAAELSDEDAASLAVFAGVLMLVIGIAAVVVSVVSIIIDSAFIKPIVYGGKRFFRKNLDEPAKVANLMYVFDNNHATVFKTSLCVTVFEFLWSLLFIVPGVIKHYEYKMIPYLLTENPEMTRKEAFAESKRLMKGNKWKAFVLDLSFIGWDILSLLTCGILGIFYVNPYKNAAEAALYEAVSA